MTFNFILVLIIFVYMIGYIFYYIYKQSKSNFSNEVVDDDHSCTLYIKDTNPNAVDSFMQFDKKHIGCGQCIGRKLNVTVATCPVNANGRLSEECNQNSNVTSSTGNPIDTWHDPVSIKKINKFFCPS